MYMRRKRVFAAVSGKNVHKKTGMEETVSGVAATGERRQHGTQLSGSAKQRAADQIWTWIKPEAATAVVLAGAQSQQSSDKPPAEVG